MIGAKLKPPQRRVAGVPGAKRLVLDGSRSPRRRFIGVTLSDVSLAVRAGEIVGVAGVAGNGQNELMEALSGERTAARADAVMLDGKAAGRTRCRRAPRARHLLRAGGAQRSRRGPRHDAHRECRAHRLKRRSCCAPA